MDGGKHSESVVKVAERHRLVKVLDWWSEFPGHYEVRGRLMIFSRILAIEVAVAYLQGKASVQ